MFDLIGSWTCTLLCMLGVSFLWQSFTWTTYYNISLQRLKKHFSKLLVLPQDFLKQHTTFLAYWICIFSVWCTHNVGAFSLFLVINCLELMMHIFTRWGILFLVRWLVIWRTSSQKLCLSNIPTTISDQDGFCQLKLGQINDEDCRSSAAF